MPTAETLTVLQVAVPTPVYGTFDYLPPHGIDARGLQAGARVRVPFGRTQATGIVMAINKASRIDPRRLRPAIAALDPAPVLGRDLLALGQWAAHYYHHPIGEVFATLLPALLRHGKPSMEVADRYWRLTAAGRAVDTDTLGRAPRQAALLGWLQPAPGVDADQLAAFDDGARATLRALLNKGWVEECAVPATISPLAAPAHAVTLNAAQRDAVERICARLAGYAPFVLEGVTGSGKTEVYLDVIDRVALRSIERDGMGRRGEGADRRRYRTFFHPTFIEQGSQCGARAVGERGELIGGDARCGLQPAQERGLSRGASEGVGIDGAPRRGESPVSLRQLRRRFAVAQERGQQGREDLADGVGVVVRGPLAEGEQVP